MAASAPLPEPAPGMHPIQGEPAARWEPLADLLEWPANPKDHTGEHVDRIRASIDRFGWLAPLVANRRTRTLVAGHGRRLAAIARGDILVPVRYVDLSDEDAELAALADNRLQELSGYDDSKLAAILRKYSDRDRAGLLAAGFDGAGLLEVLRRASMQGRGREPNPTLADRFLVPPFSVLDARQGYWQERKARWLSLGIRSELGRGERMTWSSDQVADPGFYRRRRLAEHTVSSRSAMKLAGGYENSAAGTGGTSIFDPVLCELIYRWFSPEGGAVLDPFAGGSVRGVVAAALGRRYYGIDLREEQLEANRAQWSELSAKFPSAIAPEWLCGDARDAAKVFPGEADLVFSCPPYGDLEKYSDDPADLSALEADAFDAAYAECVAAAVSRLRDNRFAAFLVGDYRDGRGLYRNFVSKTISAFEAAGARLYNEAVLVTMVGSLSVRAGRVFAASRKIGKTHQNLLVFIKGDPKKASEACGSVEVADPSEAFGETLDAPPPAANP